jgi:FkbM family methyltransferase
VPEFAWKAGGQYEKELQDSRTQLLPSQAPKPLFRWTKFYEQKPGAAVHAEIPRFDCMLRLVEMIENFIPRLLGWVPVSWRRAIIGRPDNPSRVATLVHNLLNRVAPAESKVFACQGALEGYRMSIDWNRFRSFVYGTWEPEVIQAVTATVKEGMTVVDIGAHIGYYSLLFAKCVGPAGRVFSFEPVPENFALLRKNIQLNELNQVQTFPQAIFSGKKEISIAVPDESPNSGDGSVVHNHGARQYLVPAITLDSFCVPSGVRPDILKMDVEGAEYDVLIGAQETISRCRPKLLIELHHFDGNVAAHPVPDLLAGWGYQIEWIDRWPLTSHILATSVTESSLRSLAAESGTV